MASIARGSTGAVARTALLNGTVVQFYGLRAGTGGLDRMGRDALTATTLAKAPNISLEAQLAPRGREATPSPS